MSGSIGKKSKLSLTLRTWSLHAVIGRWRFFSIPERPGQSFTCLNGISTVQQTFFLAHILYKSLILLYMRLKRERILSRTHSSVRALGYKTYDQYLKSDYWRLFQESYRASGLPQRCVACDFPRYLLHHLHYRNIGCETFADVIPLCSRCHREVHKMHSKSGIPMDRPDLQLRKIFGWSGSVTKEKFAPFRRLWSRQAKQDGEKRSFGLTVKPEEQPRHTNDYYRISRDFRNFRRYVEDGYSNADLAKMYNVSVKYVEDYLRKYPDYFPSRNKDKCTNSTQTAPSTPTQDQEGMPSSCGITEESSIESLGPLPW